MPIGVAIFFLISCIVGWFLIGLFVDMTFDCCDIYYENPLWKLPIVLLWPLALVYLVGYGIVEWIKSVIEYYKER